MKKVCVSLSIILFCIVSGTISAYAGLWVSKLDCTMRDDYVIIDGYVYEVINNETLEAAFKGIYATTEVFSKDELPDLIIPQSISIESKEYIVTEISGFGWQSYGQVISGNGDIPRHHMSRIIIPASINIVDITSYPGTAKADFRVDELIIEDSETELKSIVKEYYSYPHVWSHYGNWEIKEIKKGYIGRDIDGCSPFALQDEIITIDFGPNVTVLPDNFLFASTKQEKSFNIPPSITVVGDYAFTHSNINQITGLDHIENIGAYAFTGIDFENVDLSAAKFIGERAFSECRNLKEVKFSSRLGEIGDEAFRNNSSLEAIKLPENLLKIGNAAFQKCSLLTDIIIPGKVAHIGEEAFNGCDWLRNVIFLGNKQPNIGRRAFYHDRIKHTSFFIPNGDDLWVDLDFNHSIYGQQISLEINLEKSGDLIMHLPLDKLNNITSLKIRGANINQTDVAAINKLKNLITLDLGEGVQLPNGVNMDNSALQSISWIPDDGNQTPFVHEIIDNSESKNVNLNTCSLQSFIISKNTEEIAITPCGPFFKDLYCENEYPSNLTVPESIYENVTLHIPQGSYPRYWLDDNWNKFKNIVEYERTIAVTSLTINPITDPLVIPETRALKYEIKPNNATNKILEWSSDNETVAVVDNYGNVTAIGAGKATISAKTTDESNLKASCEIIVCNPEILVLSILLNTSSIEGKEGEQIQLVASVLPEDATNKALMWSSSDATIATVDANGLVSLLKEGTATITASSTDESGVSASCNITVRKPKILVSSITLTLSSVDGKEGEQIQINATVLPKDATNKALAWASSDESVATVNETGLISLLKKGTAVITASATDGSKVSAECGVVVMEYSGIEDILTDKNTYVKIFNLSGVLVYEGIYSVAKLVPDYYIVVCDGKNIKIKLD